jgi:hypothetical protein
MNVELAQELVDQLGSSLEKLETQHAALFQFLKDQGVVTEDQLAPYLSQAGKASGVRWRAARIRLDSLIEAEKSREEAAAEKEKRRRTGERGPDQNQPSAGQDKDEQKKNGSEKVSDKKDGEEHADQNQSGKEKDTQPKTEDTGGKPAGKEQEEDAKIAEQAYSSIPASEKNKASEKDKK